MIFNLKVFSALFRYAALHINPIRFYGMSGDLDSNTYFTLTTTPSRIGKIKPTLKSLLHQSVKPRAIILNIPAKSKKGELYTIPKSISQHPNIIIQRCDDTGPSTKLLPTLKRFEEQEENIIVVDDDQVYPRNLVSNYLEKQKIFSNHALCLCGWQFPKGYDHKNRIILRGSGLKFRHPISNIEDNTTVDIIQGASSYLVKPSFFGQEVFDLIESAFYADDIWFSGQLAKNKIGKVVVKIDTPYCRLTSSNMSEKNSLKHNENKDNRHNNMLYYHFKSYWSS